jgi:hypothetical protein
MKEDNRPTRSAFQYNVVVDGKCPEKYTQIQITNHDEGGVIAALATRLSAISPAFITRNPYSSSIYSSCLSPPLDIKPIYLASW